MDSLLASARLVCIATGVLAASPMALAAPTRQPTPSQSPRPSAVLRDWRGFRGTDGTATSDRAVATTWSDDQNIAWRNPLPGPGTSSPVVLGDALFVTCWTGYGLDQETPGEIANLRRHLLRIDRATGKTLWNRSVAPVPTEDPFAGRMATHGYASSTPVTDGIRIYALFGKSGVHAFDLDGKELWRCSVGTGSSEWTTGSGSSLAVWENLLFVNASDESHALIALDKLTGEEVWRRGARALDQAYATPVVAGAGEDAVLVFPILGEVWGLDPRSGHTLWFAKTKSQGALAPTVLVAGDRIYSFGGRTRERSYAIRRGGRGDVTATHVAWRSRYGAYVATPILVDGRLYFGDDGGILHCLDAQTGLSIYKERLGGSFYASPILAGAKLYLTSRRDGVYVVAPGPEYKLIAHNRIPADETRFDATPAACGGDLFLRSGDALYCVRADRR